MVEVPQLHSTMGMLGASQGRMVSMVLTPSVSMQQPQRLREAECLVPGHRANNKQSSSQNPIPGLSSPSPILLQDHPLCHQPVLGQSPPACSQHGSQRWKGSIGTLFIEHVLSPASIRVAMMDLPSESHHSVYSHSEQIKVGRRRLGKKKGLEIGT